MILTILQKLNNNVGNLGKIIDATGFECLPKKQKIAQSGHTDADKQLHSFILWSMWSGVNMFDNKSMFRPKHRMPNALNCVDWKLLLTNFTVIVTQMFKDYFENIAFK